MLSHAHIAPWRDACKPALQLYTAYEQWKYFIIIKIVMIIVVVIVKTLVAPFYRIKFLMQVKKKLTMHFNHRAFNCLSWLGGREPPSPHTHTHKIECLCPMILTQWLGLSPHPCSVFQFTSSFEAS